MSFSTLTLAATSSPFSLAAATDITQLAIHQSALRSETQEAAQKALQEAASVAKRIETLQTEITSLCTRIAAMTAEKECKEATIAALRTQIVEETTKAHDALAENASLKKRIDDLEYLRDYSWLMIEEFYAFIVMNSSSVGASPHDAVRHKELKRLHAKHTPTSLTHPIWTIDRLLAID